MIAEFTIEFEIKENKKGISQKHHKPGVKNYYPASRQVIRYSGNFEDGMKLLDEVKKKMGI